MKTAKPRRVKTNKINYMSDEAFAELKEAMADALAFERGKRRDLKATRIGRRVHKLTSPKDIVQIVKLNCLCRTKVVHDGEETSGSST